MSSLFEHRLTLGGFETRAIEHDGAGPPLLFLHGFSDSADTWLKLLDRMGRQGRRAVAVDLPGFATAAPLDADEKILPQLDRFAAAAVRYIAGAGSAIVVGNSLGGCLAMRAAQNARAPIEAIVPIAPAGLDMARWLVLLERDPLIRSLLAAPVPVPEWIVRRAVGQVYRTLAFARPGSIDGRVVAAFTRHLCNRASVVRTLETGRRLLPELRDPFQLERIACQVLLIWGTADRLVFPTGAERVVETVPGARLEILDDCGHCPQIEMTERLAELLFEFSAPAAAAA